MKTFKMFTEQIKGWKNAHRDLSKMRSDRSNSAKSVKLVSLKKDGTESKMHDAMSHHASEDEAVSRHNNLVKLNPNRKIAHNLYVDGKLVKTLGKD